jgi:type I restriction enzyme S subunit
MTRPTATPTNSKPALTPKLRFAEFRTGPNWETKTLGSLVTISTEKVGENECLPMSITSGVGLVSQMEKFGRVIAGSSYKNYLLLKKNDFAYNKSATKGYPEGFLALYSGDALAAVPNSIFTCFRINGASPLPQYLNYLFLGNLHGQWLRKFIEVGARAHGSLSIDENDLLALPVPLPGGKTTRAEQQKIAECLSTLDELIGAESQKLGALKAHKKGLMQQLFPREGETLPRFRFPEFQSAPEWHEVFLGDYFDPIRNGFVGTATPYYVTSGGVKYLQGRNIKEGRIEDDTLVLISDEFHTRQRKSHLKKGDLLMVQSGHVGECAVVDSVFAGANCHALIILTPKRALSSDFFVYYFYSPIGERAVFQITTGNTIKHILASELKALKVTLPSKDEQHRIATCLSSLDDLIAAQSDRLSVLQTHKQGLLQQLFPPPADANT